MPAWNRLTEMILYDFSGFHESDEMIQQFWIQSRSTGLLHHLKNLFRGHGLAVRSIAAHGIKLIGEGRESAGQMLLSLLLHGGISHAIIL